MSHQWRTLIALICAQIANIATAQPLAEPDWRTLVEPSRPVPAITATFVPTLLAEGDDGTRYLADQRHLVTIAPNGDSQVTTFLPAQQWPARGMRYLPNGHLQVWDELCRSTTYTNQGQLVWSVGGTHHYGCAQPVPGDEGMSYVLTAAVGDDPARQTLMQVGLHGQPRTLATLPMPFPERGTLLDRHPDGALVVAYFSAPSTVEIVASDPDGRRLWLTRIEHAGGYLVDMAVRADGAVDLLSTARVDDGFELRQLTVGSQGDLRANHVVAAQPSGLAFDDFLLDSAGHVLVVDTLDSALRLRRFDSDGGMQWEATRTTENAQIMHKGLHQLAGAEVLWLYGTDDSTADGVSHIERITSTGVLRHAFQRTGSGTLLVEPSGRRVHVLLQLEEASMLLALTDAGEAGPVITLPEVPSTDYPAGFPYAHVDAEIDSDGQTYLLEQVRVYETATAQLVKLDATGDVVWREALGDVPDGGWNGMISCSADHLCLGGSGEIRKLAKRDGSFVWRSPAYPDGRLYAYDDGAVLSVSQSPGPFFPRLARLSLVDRNGVAVTLGEDGFSFLVDFHPQHGALLLRFGETETSLELLGSGGELTDFLRPVPESIGQWATASDRRVAALLDDQRRLTLLQDVVIGTGDDARLERQLIRAADGRVQWTMPLPDNRQVVEPARMLALAEGDVVVSFHPVQYREPTPHVLARYDDDGDEVWYRELSMAATDLFVGPDDRLLLLSRRPGSEGSVLAIHDPDSGDVVRQRVLDCQHEYCAEEAIHVMSDGRLLAAAEGHSRTGWPVRSFSGLFGDPAYVLLDQTALSGFWYAPAATGQGFSLQFFPESNGIFMPWYTFDTGDGTSLERLRWYVLEGEIHAGDGEAILPIAQVTGGRFDRPGQRKTLVGEARLRFESCDHGLLDYRFDAPYNDGAQGTVALQRMLPSTDDCLEVGGGILPAQADIDPMPSGVWYDPETPGQGLHLLGMSGSSIFFGAWYTFDPQPAQDGADDQHWFTLQQWSPIDGGFTAGIFQTLGGSLDRVATRNVYRIGTAEMRSLSCDRLELSYVFDGDPNLEFFTNQTGTIQLYRLGDCPAH
jgi:hypothetical protein